MSAPLSPRAQQVKTCIATAIQWIELEQRCTESPLAIKFLAHANTALHEALAVLTAAPEPVS